MNKTINQQKTGFEYVLIDDGFGEEEGYFTWLVDYDEGEARYKESIPFLDVTDIALLIYKGCIGNYLEEQGYIIHEGISDETYIKFEKE